MRKKSKKRKNVWQELILTLIIICLFIYTDAMQSESSVAKENGVIDMTNETATSFDLSTIPEYEESPFVVLNNNVPNFNAEHYKDGNFETYSELDEYGRCGVAFANVCKDIMPPEGDKRGKINSVTPSRLETKNV